MIKLIVGVKGTGKTKTLIEMVNAAIENSKGSVVCLEKGDKLKFDINYRCRLIDTDEYLISDAQALSGFISGIIASNRDITDLFVDGTLKICGGDVAAVAKAVEEIAAISEKMEFNCVMTMSLPAEEIPENIKKYL